jgi:hypothetical protein
MCNADDMTLRFFAEEFQSRELEVYRQQCAELIDENIDRQQRRELSRDYGVNYLSVLDQVHHFDVCKYFPQDTMHVLFEGVLNTQVN